jgi:hypothetical protein
MKVGVNKWHPVSEWKVTRHCECWWASKLPQKCIWGCRSSENCVTGQVGPDALKKHSAFIFKVWSLNLKTRSCFETLQTTNSTTPRHILAGLGSHKWCLATRKGFNNFTNNNSTNSSLWFMLYIPLPISSPYAQIEYRLLYVLRLKIELCAEICSKIICLKSIHKQKNCIEEDLHTSTRTLPHIQSVIHRVCVSMY